MGLYVSVILLSFLAGALVCFAGLFLFLTIRKTYMRICIYSETLAHMRDAKEEVISAYLRRLDHHPNATRTFREDIGPILEFCKKQTGWMQKRIYAVVFFGYICISMLLGALITVIIKNSGNIILVYRLSGMALKFLYLSAIMFVPVLTFGLQLILIRRWALRAIVQLVADSIWMALFEDYPDPEEKIICLYLLIHLIFKYASEDFYKFVAAGEDIEDSAEAGRMYIQLLLKDISNSRCSLRLTPRGSKILASLKDLYLPEAAEHKPWK